MADVIKNWIRTRYTIEFLGTWELIHNPNFKVVEFDHFRMQAGLPNFTLSASEWIEKIGYPGRIPRGVVQNLHCFGSKTSPPLLHFKSHPAKGGFIFVFK